MVSWETGDANTANNQNGWEEGAGVGGPQGVWAGCPQASGWPQEPATGTGRGQWEGLCGREVLGAGTVHRAQPPSTGLGIWLAHGLGLRSLRGQQAA